MKYKKIIFDIILNIIASAIPIAGLQLIIFPQLAQRVGSERYGLALTEISFFLMFSQSFGNALNNVRLLNSDTDDSGNFNLISLADIVVCSIIMGVGTFYYEGRFSLLSFFGLSCIAALNILREYLIVAFRLKLDYKKILYNNLLLCVGYFIGFIFMMWSNQWFLIYISGYTLSLIYIIKNSDLLQYGFRSTPNIKKVFINHNMLTFSIFVKASLTYADRLIIYPLIGGTAVSIYYASTIIGKIISMVISPISSVILSYLTKVEKVKLRLFGIMLGAVSGVCFCGYFVCVAISKPLLMFLYPELVSQALPMVKITTLTIMVDVICSVLHPFLLRFNGVKWQVVINSINLFSYITLSILLFKKSGLIGFCTGLLIANILKLLIMLIIYLSQYRHNGKETS